MKKNNIDIDRLIDKGWNQMAKTLEEQMPQERRGHKKHWLVAAALLLIFLSTAGYYLLVKKPSIDAISGNNAVQRIIYEEKNNDVVNLIDAGLQKNDLADHKMQENTGISQKRKNPHTGLTENAAVHSDKKSIQISVVPPVAQKKSRVDKTVDMKRALNSKEFSVKRVDFNVIPDLYAGISCAQRELPLTFEPVIKPVTVKNANSSVSLALDVITENGQSLGGGDVQLLYKRRINGYMSLETGLEFTAMKKYGMANSFFKTYNLKDPIFNINTEILDPPDYNKNFLSPVFLSKFIDDLYYIGMPLLLEFNYSRVEILFGADIKYMIAGTNYTVKRGRIGQFTYEIPYRTTFYDNDLYRKWDISAVFGFNIDLTKRLALHTDVNFSWMGIIDSPDYGYGNQFNTGEIFYRFNEANRYDRNVYGTVGLKYRFWTRR